MSLRIALTSVYGWPEVNRGGERYLHELAAALARAGHRPRVWVTGPDAGTDRVLDVPVVRVPRRRWRPSRHGELADQLAFGPQAFLRLAARPDLDVWHATSTGDGAAAALAGRLRPGLATVFTDHGYPARRSRDARTDRRFHRVVVDHVGAYVCVSEPAGRFLRDDYGRVPDVVPPGVSTAGYAPGPREERPTVLYAGSLVEPRKNVGLLLEAVAAVRAEVEDLQVWLCGPGDPGPLLRAAPPAARDAVAFAGLVPPDELAGRYARAWATALPSHAESFGMVVVESFASGTPAVVLADSGGPATIVTPGTGVAVDDDVASLAEGLRAGLDLARDPATVEACRARAEEYDWDAAVVPRLEEVYARA